MNKGKKMRDYTITSKPYKDGEIFYHDGVKYQRNHIGGAIFDNKFAGKAELDEYISDSKLSTREYYKKYPK